MSNRYTNLQARRVRSGNFMTKHLLVALFKAANTKWDLGLPTRIPLGYIEAHRWAKQYFPVIADAAGLELDHNPTGHIRFAYSIFDIAGKTDEELNGPDLDTMSLTVVTTQADQVFELAADDFGVYDANIEWGDGEESVIAAFDDAGLSHTFAEPGTYEVLVAGSFPAPRMEFSDAASKEAVTAINRFGDLGLQSLRGAFYGCSNMAVVNQGEVFDFTQVADMRDAFRDVGSNVPCVLNLPDVCTAANTSLNSTFSNCSQVTSIDTSNWDTSNVDSLFRTFDNCKALTSLSLGGWDTSKVGSLYATFQDCWALATLDVSGWNLNACTTASSAFKNCLAIPSIDLSSWAKTAGASISFTECFQGCSALASVLLPQIWAGASGTASSMFKICGVLATVDATGFDLKITSASNMFRQSGLAALALGSFDFSTCTNLSYMFFASDIQTLDWAGADLTAATNMSQMCNGCSQLQSCDFSALAAAPAALTNLSTAFAGCSQLTSLDLSNFDFSSLTALSIAFNGCSTLATLLLPTGASAPAGGSLVSLLGAFQGCYTLTALDLSGWDVSGATNLSSAFSNCLALATLDLTGWAPVAATTMASMFASCYALATAPDFSAWDTSNCADFGGMFISCYAMEDLDISGFDLSGLDATDGLEYLCYATDGIMTTEQYDALLIAWEAQAPFANMANVDFDTVQFTLGGAAEAARDSLINTYGWGINDGGGIVVGPALAGNYEQFVVDNYDDANLVIAWLTGEAPTKTDAPYKGLPSHGTRKGDFSWTFANAGGTTAPSIIPESGGLAAVKTDQSGVRPIGEITANGPLADNGGYSMWGMFEWDRGENSDTMLFAMKDGSKFSFSITLEDDGNISVRWEDPDGTVYYDTDYAAHGLFHANTPFFLGIAVGAAGAITVVVDDVDHTAKYQTPAASGSRASQIAANTMDTGFKWQGLCLYNAPLSAAQFQALNDAMRNPPV